MRVNQPRLIASLIASIMFVLVIVGLSPAGYAQNSGQDDPLVFGLAAPDLSISFWTSIAYGVTDEAERQGVEVQLVSAGGDSNVVRQISQIQDLMQRRVDALIVGATNGQAVTPVVEGAIARGIPVVGLSSLPETDKLASAVGADHYGMGELQARCLGEQLGGTGYVGVMAGPAGQSWAEDRVRGFQETVTRDYPDMVMVAVNNTSDNRNAALTLMDDWLQRFPDLDGVYTATDDIGAGAADAIQAANKTGRILVSSSNLSPIGERYLRDGLLACETTQQVVLQGREAVRQAIAAVTGGEVRREVITSVIFVDRENIDEIDFSSVRAPEGYQPN